MNRKDHWENIYATKQDAQVSWTQSDPRTSLQLIGEVCPSGRVIDIGGGTSILADRLVDGDYHVVILDISQAALDRSRLRLGPRGEQVQWIAADVTQAPDLGTVDLWHDRAVFHFLTEPADRATYVALLARTVRPGGHVVIATFALDGPAKCSGLDVQRYDAASLAATLGNDFALLKSEPEIHQTPWGKPQSFQYSLFRRA
ncbi:MAG: class I SAM-dependent methyltransferase [Phycisphaerales bacterium]